MSFHVRFPFTYLLPLLRRRCRGESELESQRIWIRKSNRGQRGAGRVVRRRLRIFRCAFYLVPDSMLFSCVVPIKINIYFPANHENLVLALPFSVSFFFCLLLFFLTCFACLIFSFVSFVFFPSFFYFICFWRRRRSRTPDRLLLFHIFIVFFNFSFFAVSIFF